MPEIDTTTPARLASMRTFTARYDPYIDAAYQHRIRRQCSREDFAEGYVAAMLDWMPIGAPHERASTDEHQSTPD
jgi:hypothetical protein